MRSARLVVLAATAAGVVVLALLAVTHRTNLAFTLGVIRAAPVVSLAHDQSACQRPIDVPGGGRFDRVALSVGTFQRAGSPLEVTIRGGQGRLVGRGVLPGGYPDIAQAPVHQVRLGRSVGPQRVVVCVRNQGDRRIALYGNADAAARSSTAFKDGRPIKADLSLEFERGSRSLASELPRLLDRAALFRAPWLGAWTYWILAVALLLGAPWLLVRALRTAAISSEPGAGSPR
jgi:hypothetical protein